MIVGLETDTVGITGFGVGLGAMGVGFGIGAGGVESVSFGDGNVGGTALIMG